MNAPMTATQQYASVINPYMGVNGGTNSSHSSTTTNYDANGNPVGGLQGALGGGLAGYQAARNLGFGSSSVPAQSAASSSSTGWGTGDYYGNQDYGSYY